MTDAPPLSARRRAHPTRETKNRTTLLGLGGAILLVCTVVLIIDGQYATALITALLLILAATLIMRTLSGPAPLRRQPAAGRHLKQRG